MPSMPTPYIPRGLTGNLVKRLVCTPAACSVLIRGSWPPTVWSLVSRTGFPLKAPKLKSMPQVPLCFVRRGSYPSCGRRPFTVTGYDLPFVSSDFQAQPPDRVINGTRVLDCPINDVAFFVASTFSGCVVDLPRHTRDGPLLHCNIHVVDQSHP